MDPHEEERQYPLINELDKLFNEDSNIDELGVIFNNPPPHETSNESDTQSRDHEDPQFILQEHKLGVSIHCLHPLLNEARAALPSARASYLRARESASVFDLQDRFEDSVREAQQTAEILLSVTRALLLINADHGSAWNARKLVVRDGLLGSLREEIKLLNLIFTKHAKSPNAWAHRRWCWRNDLQSNACSDRCPLLSVPEELQLCERVADLYPKNYYAWTQRSWVVLREVERMCDFAQATAEQGTSERAMTMLENELSFVNQWLKSHVSDHSALNHRKNMASALATLTAGTENNKRVSDDLFAVREVRDLCSLIKNYPGHESLWCYRRFVCQASLATMTTSTMKSQRHCAVMERPVSETRAKGRDDEIDASREELCRDVVNMSSNLSTVSMAEAPLSTDTFDWRTWMRDIEDLYEHLTVQDEDEDYGDDDHERTFYQGAYDVSDPSGMGSYEATHEVELTHGGSPLTDLFNREVRFVLECATDKGVWQHQQQRRHALTHLAFLTYVAHRIVNPMCGRYHPPLPEQTGDADDDPYDLASGTMTRSPALMSHLKGESMASNQAAHCSTSTHDDDSCLHDTRQAIHALNSFVIGLMMDEQHDCDESVDSSAPSAGDKAQLSATHSHWRIGFAPYVLQETVNTSPIR